MHSWFKFNNLWVTLGMALKFYTSLEKELKLKFKRFFRNYKGKTRRETFCSKSSTGLRVRTLANQEILRISLKCLNLMTRIQTVMQKPRFDNYVGKFQKTSCSTFPRPVLLNFVNFSVKFYPMLSNFDQVQILGIYIFFKFQCLKRFIFS